jgi:chromosome segregation ATPase
MQWLVSIVHDTITSQTLSMNTAPLPPISNHTLPNQNPIPRDCAPESIMNHIFYLRREWEHELNKNHLVGREKEHIEQLLHSQFQFLEHVVLDMSRQLRTLQEQVLQHQSSNQLVMQKMSSIEKLHLETKHHCIDALSGVQKQHLELIQKKNDLESKLKQFDSRMQEHVQKSEQIHCAIQNHDNRIQALLEKVEQLKEHHIKETNRIDAAIESSSKLSQQDHVSMKQSLQHLHSQYTTQHANLESSIHNVSSTIQRNHKHANNTIQAHKEQVNLQSKNMIETLTALKNCFLGLRKEQDQLEQRLKSQLNSTLNLFKDQYSHDIRLASKPIIVH